MSAQPGYIITPRFEFSLTHEFNISRAANAAFIAIYEEAFQRAYVPDTYKNDEHIVMSFNRTPVGICITWPWHTRDFTPLFYISSFAVDKSAWRKKHGTRFLEELAECARSRRHKQMALHAKIQPDHVPGFYRKNGFRDHIFSEKNPLENTIQMVKDL